MAKAATPISSAQHDLQSARDVLHKEAEALNRMAEQLDENFVKAVEILAQSRGRVIISGMGKSGHIGAKIAATLASTGTPAFFVHPGEASHGDLGMITRDDVVIAISHSGETRELSDLLAFCARFKVPLIAMVGRETSTLAQAADVVLLNRVTEEACPLNLAPTTSTTAMLALGDALAVSLMLHKGFRPEDFAQFHPGGKLGSRLLRVRQLMVTGSDVPLVDNRTLMSAVLLEMSSKALGLVGVTDADDKLIGMITDGDLRRHMNSNLLTKTAAEVMTAGPMTIGPDALATAAVALMQDNEKKRNITALFVVDAQHRPEGVIHIHHCLRAGVI